MTNKNILIFFGIAIHCFGCSTSIPEADLSIVDAKKNQLIQQWANTPKSQRLSSFHKIMKSEYGHVQPLNKKESCKIPNLKYPEFVDVKHSVFWDGECSNGYGVGLGRIIVKSSYDHFELIMNLPPDGLIPTSAYQWFRDYVHNRTEYGFDYATGESEVAADEITNKDNNLEAIHYIGAFTVDGSYVTRDILSSSGKSTMVFYANPFYSYIKTIIPDPTRDVNYGLVTLAAGNSVGVSKVVFKNGLSATYIHPDVKNQVRVPDNYFDNMLYELNKAQEYSSKANAQAQTAKKMFDIYLYKACNNGNKTDGIDSDLYRQICVYESQVSEIIGLITKNSEYNQRNRLDQINQQRLIRAREVEAAAAQEQATAIQQLNNNLSRPKSTTCLNMGFGIVNCSSH